MFILLSREDLKVENESEIIIIAQGRAIQTKYYAAKILQSETDNSM